MTTWRGRFTVDFLVVATGSVAPLAERICWQIGIIGVEVVGSTLRRWYGGWVADKHCFGRRKVSMLRAYGLNQWDVVYTDSAADLPLLTQGAHRYVVNPTPKDRKKICDRLGADLEVVEWH
jgi:phosphatidylglycerophosphatase C